MDSETKPRRYAPDNPAGQHAYAVTLKYAGHTSTRVEYAGSLAEAKRRWGWTRAQHTSITVRRARPEDVA